jgi:hypothetical protein
VIPQIAYPALNQKQPTQAKMIRNGQIDHLSAIDVFQTSEINAAQFAGSRTVSFNPMAPFSSVLQTISTAQSKSRLVPLCCRSLRLKLED